MPGFDGRGPNGMGPMTGGGRGYCVVPEQGVQNRPFDGGFYRRGRGFGGGRGRGFEGGRGFGRGWARRQRAGVNFYDYPSGEFTSKEEAEILKEQVKFMQEEINFVNNRIKELESAKSREEDRKQGGQL